MKLVDRDNQPIDEGHNEEVAHADETEQQQDASDNASATAPQATCAIALFMLPDGGVRFQVYDSEHGVQRQATEADILAMCNEMQQHLLAQRIVRLIGGSLAPQIASAVAFALNPDKQAKTPAGLHIPN